MKLTSRLHIQSIGWREWMDEVRDNKRALLPEFYPHMNGSWTANVGPLIIGWDPLTQETGGEEG